MHDFVIDELGRANPYGVYGVAANEAWVSVGTDHDRVAFAVESIRRWWTDDGPGPVSRRDPALGHRMPHLALAFVAANGLDDRITGDTLGLWTP